MIAISARCSDIVSVLQKGRTSPVSPSTTLGMPSLFGADAPKMLADFIRWSLGATGRLPRSANRRVVVFFPANPYFAWNQPPIGVRWLGRGLLWTFATTAAKPPL